MAEEKLQLGARSSKQNKTKQMNQKRIEYLKGMGMVNEGG